MLKFNWNSIEQDGKTYKCYYKRYEGNIVIYGYGWQSLPEIDGLKKSYTNDTNDDVIRVLPESLYYPLVLSAYEAQLKKESVMRARRI